jgi:DNA-binding response OmpR family regulator
VDTEEKATILLVDDNRHLMVTLTDYLTYEGFNVVQARSAEEALRKLPKEEPDLIILDICMPGMGGVGFLRRISDDGGRPKYPVLVFTARANMETFFDSLEVDGFVSKPCSEAELMRKVRAILADRERQRQLQEQVTGPRRAMVVEDDPEIRIDMVRAFTSAGFEVTVVETGPQALDRAASEPPDILIVKKILPKMNGDVVASLAKAMPSLKEVPFILYDDTHTEEELLVRRVSTPRDVNKLVLGSDPDDLLRAARNLLGG